MFRKSFDVMAAIFLTLSVAGCTAYSDISADKSVLPYVEMFATGRSAHIADAGISKQTEQEIYDDIHQKLMERFSSYPLNKQTLEKVVDDYLKYLQEVTKVTTTLKKDDSKEPIVEVKATVIDESGFDDLSQYENLDGFSELLARVQTAKDSGVTLEQLKADEEFQKFAANCIDKMLRSMPVNERTLEVICTRLQGEDAKMYWGPADIETLVKFSQGQKI
ncbi:MAG: hypothetical protein IKZ58_00880 [Selenomonadaceae bacterium]|nr:hypothetical protein [Selenomonadaceae bacterium]